MAFLKQVRRRRDGAKVYEVRWREGKTQRREQVGLDKVYAQARLAEVRALEHEAKQAEAAPKDAAELVARFLAAMRLKGLRPATLAYYEQRLRFWVKATAGVAPSLWSPKHLEQVRAAHPDWSPRSHAILVRVLGRLTRWARKAGTFVPNVTQGAELARYTPRKRTPLSTVEADRLMAAAEGHHYAPAVALALFAGLSLGDLRSITWGEVDLETGWIIRSSGRQKTGEVLRIPILPELDVVLRRTRPLHPSPAEQVCAGLPVTSRSLYRTLRMMLEAAGIERPKGDAWHLLRHSFGTMLMRARIPTAIIGRLLSHRPGSAITALYQHPEDADLVKAMADARALREAERAAGKQA